MSRSIVVRPITSPELWYLVFHTLFYLDFYLSEAEAGFVPPAPYTLDELDPAGIMPERAYSKDEMRKSILNMAVRSAGGRLKH